MSGVEKDPQDLFPKVLLAVVLFGCICSGAAFAAETGQETATVSTGEILNATNKETQETINRGISHVSAQNTSSPVDWTFIPDKNTTSISRVATVNGTALVSTDPGTSDVRRIKAIDIETGTHRWTSNITGVQGFGNIQPVVAGNQMAFVSVDDHIYALDIETGEQRWQKDAFGTPRLTYKNETLYAHADGAVRAFYTNGTEQWETPASSGSTASAPLVTDKSVAILTACESNQSRSVLCYTSFDRENGEVKSHFVTGTEATSGGVSEAVMRDGTVFVTAGNEFTRADAKAVAIDLENGSLVEFASVETGSRVAVSETKVFVSIDVNDKVVALNRDGYGEAWRAPGATPTRFNGQLLTVAGEVIRSYNPQTGELRRSTTPQPGTPLARTISSTSKAVLVQSEEFTFEPGLFALESEFFESPIRITPSKPTTGTSVTVSAPTIDASSYEWEFTGDNTTEARGNQVSYTFETSGEVTVTLTVTSNGEKETYTRTFLVREPLNSSLTIESRYPKPGSFVTLNASKSTGTGTLQYEWVVDGNELYCSDPVCTIEVGEKTTNVSVTVRDERGRTETQSQTIRPTAITLDRSIDNTPSTAYIYDKTLLLTESSQIRVNDNQWSADAHITNVSVNGPATVEGTTPIKLSPTGVGMATLDVKIESRERQYPITRSIKFTLVEFDNSDGRFDYELRVENRTNKALFARFQSQIETDDRRHTASFTAQQVEQRIGALPEEVHIIGGDPDAERFDEYAGYASPPNKVVLSPTLTEGQAFKFYGAQEVLRHELTHLAQYELNMETDGDWNFLLEGHAVYESDASPELIRSKPQKTYLLEWNGTRSEYQKAGAFVDAFMAEYGRQTFLDLVKNSEGTDLQTQFKQTTGESFDSFYSRWLSGESNDPARKRGSLPHVTFYYEDSKLIADATKSATATWDVDDDGVDELTGERVSWTPNKSGDYEITLTLNNGEHTLSQTQIIEPGTVNVEDLTFDPNIVDTNTTNDHTVTFDAENVSDDGTTDTLTVSFPSETTVDSINDVSVADADGTTISIASSAELVDNGTSVSFDVSPDSDGEYRDLSVTVDATVTAPDVAKETTAVVTASVTDSNNGEDSASTTLTVQSKSTSEVPAVVGDSPAQDLNNDGTYEDLNGDGEFNIVDVNGLFQNYNSDTVQDNPTLFDFNDDGQVNIVDVNRLFQSSQN